MVRFLLISIVALLVGCSSTEKPLIPNDDILAFQTLFGEDFQAGATDKGQQWYVRQHGEDIEVVDTYTNKYLKYSGIKDYKSADVDYIKFLTRCRRKYDYDSDYASDVLIGNTYVAINSSGKATVYIGDSDSQIVQEFEPTLGFVAVYPYISTCVSQARNIMRNVDSDGAFCPNVKGGLVYLTSDTMFAPEANRIVATNLAGPIPMQEGYSFYDEFFKMSERLAEYSYFYEANGFYNHEVCALYGDYVLAINKDGESQWFYMHEINDYLWIG